LRAEGAMIRANLAKEFLVLRHTADRLRVLGADTSQVRGK
jgi:hypothetical protein